MSKDKTKEINWLTDVDGHNYPAAESYLTILYGQEIVVDMIARLKNTGIVQFKAKDIFRASQLSLLGVSNSHVEKDIDKIMTGKSLSPLLLVRDQQNGKVIIADGYHRLCAIYKFNEDAFIQCKII